MFLNHYSMLSKSFASFIFLEESKYDEFLCLKKYQTLIMGRYLDLITFPPESNDDVFQFSIN